VCLPCTVLSCTLVLVGTGAFDIASLCVNYVRFSKVIDDRRPGVQMARILQYLECPQYLRKSFFPQHKDLEYAGWLFADFLIIQAALQQHEALCHSHGI